VQNPIKILKPYIQPGWTILDVGPGMGYFTIPLATLAGPSGKVIAADLQPEMLEGVRKRAVKAGVADRIKLHQAQPDKIGVSEALDFCLAFWMVHEVPDRARFIGEIVNQLMPGGLFLVVEPKIHVSKASFDASVEIATNLGMAVVAQPKIFISYAAVLKK
jgi:ubiquinone/menaquinone biosynthesis C-methylase UbiE